MDLQRIADAVLKATGAPPRPTRADEREGLGPALVHADIREYVSYCLPSQPFMASGVEVKTFVGILEEVAPGVSPGGVLLRFGYLPIATSISGNAVCLDGVGGTVTWADHESFLGDLVSRELPNGAWEDLPLSAASVKLAMKPLASEIEPFLLRLLRGELDEFLEDFDRE